MSFSVTGEEKETNLCRVSVNCWTFGDLRGFIRGFWDFAPQPVAFLPSAICLFLLFPVLRSFPVFGCVRTLGPPPLPPLPRVRESISVIYGPGGGGIPVIPTASLWLPWWHPNSTDRRSRPPPARRPFTSAPGDAGHEAYGRLWEEEGRVINPFANKMQMRVLSEDMALKMPSPVPSERHDFLSQPVRVTFTDTWRWHIKLRSKIDPVQVVSGSLPARRLIPAVSAHVSRLRKRRGSMCGEDRRKPSLQPLRAVLVRNYMVSDFPHSYLAI